MSRFFFLLILILNVTCSTPTDKAPVITRIEPVQLQKMLTEKEIQVIDVRTAREVSFGTISRARHLDFYDQEFVSSLNTLDKDLPVVVYCASGLRSEKASEVLAASGFVQIYDLQGGIMAWQLAGLGITKNE